MEKNTQTNKECSQERGTRVQKRAVRAVALDAHLEVFAQAVAGGASRIAAAVICNRSVGSASYLYRQPGVKERIAELQTIARSATEKTVAADAIRMRGAVDIDRNEIINLLSCIARDPKQLGAARVRALMALADIYMLRARNVEDLKNLIGWTEDETQEFIRTKVVPRRIAALTGYSTVNDFAPQPSPQTEKQ